MNKLIMDVVLEGWKREGDRIRC